MKYLVVLGLLAVGLWLWRSNRRVAAPPPEAKTPSLTTKIVACDLCGVHLPLSEALTGPSGMYCTESHRRQAESAP